MKEKGVLLPIFSLPSNYWEILPINSCNGLPYSPISYYAL